MLRSAPVSLAQVQSTERLGEMLDLEEEVGEPAKKGVASIKAPTDPKKLMLVQLNNEKPPKKKIAPPKARLLQLDADIKIDE